MNPAFVVVPSIELIGDPSVAELYNCADVHPTLVCQYITVMSKFENKELDIPAVNSICTAQPLFVVSRLNAYALVSTGGVLPPGKYLIWFTSLT